MNASFAVLFTYCVLASAPSPSSVGMTTPIDMSVVAALHPTELQVVEKTNRERVRHGLRPVRVDTRLMGSARRHCQWMTQANSLQHTSDPVAENIAMGQGSSSEAVRDWMNSPGHRANILTSGHRRIGVAAYRTRSGSIYWCQQFTH